MSEFFYSGSIEVIAPTRLIADDACYLRAKNQPKTVKLRGQERYRAWAVWDKGETLPEATALFRAAKAMDIAEGSNYFLTLELDFDKVRVIYHLAFWRKTTG